jgi:hypothetical protein
MGSAIKFLILGSVIECVIFLLATRNRKNMNLLIIRCVSTIIIFSPLLQNVARVV